MAGDDFRVQRTMCSTCIYRPSSPLDLQKLESDVADNYGGFNSFRVCHHTSGEQQACCAGFWAKHKDHFQLGQVAQRLNCVVLVDVDCLKEKTGGK